MHSQTFNPRIRKVKVGIRKEIREVEIFPLSIYDQEQFSEMIVETFLSLFGSEGDIETSEIVAFAAKLIKENLRKIIGLITDEGEDLLKDVDNTQLTDIAVIVFEMNYANEDISKNVKSLSKKIKGLFLLERPQQQSVQSTQDTPSTESFESPTEKEDSPTDS